MTKNSKLTLAVVYRPPDVLKAYANNARTHSKDQIRRIRESINKFGFLAPVLIDATDTIVAGHGRVAAAKLLGMSEVPTIRVEHLSPDQRRAYALADNRLAEIAGWDKDILAAEFQHLFATDNDLDIPGFEPSEIDLILAPLEDKPDPDDEVIVPQPAETITQPGDIWQLGRHRILCGSSIQEKSFSQLLGKKRAGVVFTDPPYNVKIDGNVTGNGSVRHREFQMASGEMDEFQFSSFLSASLRLLSRYSVNGSIHFLFIDWRHMGELLSAGRQAYESLLNVCVWFKNNGGMGSLYRSQHELIFVFRNGKGPHRNNVQLGRYGRNRTNVWQYPGASTFSKVSEEGNLLALHPTVKPVALVADALLDCSVRGDIVVDAFLGSGSTVIAAERTGRSCYGIELDPAYVDTAVRRWQKYSGDDAVHVGSGRQFNDIMSESERNRE